MTSNYESLALHYANEALILKAVATVHLENSNDEFFWNPILEHIKPGMYNFVGFSKNENDVETSGCAQCLKFKGYLSKKFFVCMDSDYRIFGIGDSVSANEFYAQTYTYSWENHLCFAADLQNRLTTALKGKNPSVNLDFIVFLDKFSKAVYPIVLQYLSMKRDGVAGFTKGMFNNLFEFHLVNADYANDGDGIIRKLNAQFSAFIAPLKSIYNFNLQQEIAYYAPMGLSQENAYLRMRGHTLYNFINKIGSHICKGTRIAFGKNVLKDAVLYNLHYPEMNSLIHDVQQILLNVAEIRS